MIYILSIKWLIESIIVEIFVSFQMTVVGKGKGKREGRGEVDDTSREGKREKGGEGGGRWVHWFIITSRMK